MTGSDRYRQRRYKHLNRDPVTEELRAEVLALDGWRCVARRLDPNAGVCKNKWNDAIITSGRYPTSALTLDHVKDQPRLGKRAPSDVRHLATLCWHHHLNGWATANRPLLRAYLATRSGVPE